MAAQHPRQHSHQHPAPGPALSRLQLAAALIEYDNDEDDPRSDRYRSHRASAMFLPFIPRPPGPPTLRPIPHHQTIDEDAVASRRPVQDDRPMRMRDSMTMEILEGRKRPSIDEEEEEAELVEEERAQPTIDRDVDVSRWDLPDHLVSQAGAAPIVNAPRSRPDTASSARPSSRQFPVIRPGSTYAASSSGPTANVSDQPGADVYGLNAALESVEKIKRLVNVDATAEAADPERERIRTRSGGDLGLRDRRTARVSFSDIDVYDRPSTSMGLMPTSPRSAMSPRASMDRASRSSVSFGPSHNHHPVFVPLPTSPARSRSRQSSTFIPDLADDGDVGAEEAEPNPFAMPAPPPELGSRFDPKQLESQRSQSALSRPLPDRVSHPPSRSSAMYDSDARATSHRHTLELPDEQDITEHLFHSTRPISDRAGRDVRPEPPRVYDEIPSFEEYGKPLLPARYSTNRPQRLSRHDLLRPKTLVMPQSLANLPPPASPPRKKWEIAPDGFEIGGEKPLPAGARTSVLTIGGVARIPLSLSQRTFRSSLMVGGEVRDAAWVGGAEEEGEVGVSKKERDDLGEELLERRPGKLYGKSLMDQLDARKQAMKGKQRQFTGDNRPAMMARASVGPQSSTSPTAARGPGPLLQFDEHGNVHESHSHSPTKPEVPSQRHSLAPPSRPTDRLTKSTSVFGVDEIWEKEMAKLRIMQENERAEKAREEEQVRLKEEAKAAKKNKGKRKKKAESGYEPVALRDEAEADQKEGQDQDLQRSSEVVVEGFSPIRKTGDLPPMVTFSPEKAPVKSAPRIAEEKSEVGEERDAAGLPRRELSEGGSDSEDDIPLSRFRRSTLDRRPTSGLDKPSPSAPVLVAASESSDDEDADIPLSQLRKPKPTAPTAPHKASPDKPVLSIETDFAPSYDQVEQLHTTGSLGLALPATAIEKTMADLTQPSISQPTGGEEEDDDVPLLLRQAHIKATAPAVTGHDDDDDDVPLGLRQTMRHSSMTFSPIQPPHPGAFMSPYGHPASVYGYPPQQPSWPSPFHHHHHHQQQQQHAFGYPFAHMPAPSPMAMGMPHHMSMNMAMPPLPNFSMMSLPMPTMDGAGHVQVQHDNIDSWRKGVAPPSVSGESRG